VGTGIAFEKILKLNEHGWNEGVDISSAMLSAAHRRVRKYDTSRFHLGTGNAYSLPYDDSEFDLVINNYMLDLLPERDFGKVLGEFYRVLRQSGRIAVCAMAFGAKWYNHPWHWVARNFPSLLTNCRPVLVEKHLSAAGFTNVRVEFVSQNTFPSQIVTAIKP
jgi:ubiquinone/menaquinone biosynthesis C-methylase UbiE